MRQTVIISTLALASAFGTTVMAMETDPVFVALTLDQRVELRRQERLLAESSSGSSSSSLSRYRYASSSSTTLFQRVQDRLQQRLNDLRLRDPEEYNSVIDMLRRREQRRSERLENTPLSLKQEVMDGVNLERAKRGLGALRNHRKLEAAAQAHAQDMFDRDYFDHESPEGDRVGTRVKATGYGDINAQECRCSYNIYIGENIAKGQQSAKQVVREWMESPSHRDAILFKEYKEVGVGIVDTIWVLNFGGVHINPVE